MFTVVLIINILLQLNSLGFMLFDNPTVCNHIAHFYPPP